MILIFPWLWVHIPLNYVKKCEWQHWKSFQDDRHGKTKRLDAPKKWKTMGEQKPVILTLFFFLFVFYCFLLFHVFLCSRTFFRAFFEVFACFSCFHFFRQHFGFFPYTLGHSIGEVNLNQQTLGASLCTSQLQGEKHLFPGALGIQLHCDMMLFGG